MGRLNADDSGERVEGPAAVTVGKEPVSDGGGKGVENAYLLSARSAQWLLDLDREARAMYVAGLNAQLAVGRAGLDSAGFERISARLNELAVELRDVVQAAGQRAARVVRRVHRVEMARRCVTALETAGADEAGRTHADGRLAEEERILALAMKRLRAALETIDGRLEEADHLVLGARVEAAKVSVPQARAQIGAVADRLGQSAAGFRTSLEAVRPDLRVLAR